MRVLLDVTPVAAAMLRDMHYTQINTRVLVLAARAIKYEVDRVVYGEVFARQVKDVFMEEFIALVSALENTNPQYKPPMGVPIQYVRDQLTARIRTLLQTAYDAMQRVEGIVIVNYPDPLTISYERVLPERVL